MKNLSALCKALPCGLPSIAIDNPQRFVKDYLNVNLKPFQKILIYMMMLSNYFMYIAARGLKATPFSNVWMIRAENR